jgi:4-amino-4-deoxy-L-arabinose transferase-like glycosyltransferase
VILASAKVISRWRPVLMRVAPMAAVVVLAMIAFLGRLDCPLQEPDETRYAEIARQMLRDGEWLTPTYHARPYPDKPPLLYWLTMTVSLVLGPTEAAAHLTAGLCGLATLLAVFLWARSVGGERGGWVAVAVLLLFPRYVYLARQLTPDTLLTACVVSAWAGLVIATRDRFRAGPWYVAAVAVGLGVLAKGPVACVLVLGPYLYVAITRRVAWKHLLGFGAVALGVAAPWFVAVALARPEWAAEFFWKHNVGRFVAAFDHVQPAWYFLPGLAVALAPWFALVVLVRAREPGRIHGLGLLAAGICVVFFSAAACKRSGYILPAYPALAVALAGPVIARLQFARWPMGVAGVVTGLGVLIALPAYADGRSMKSLARHVEPGEPVVCYERPCDGAAFYLRLPELPAYAPEHRDELLRKLAEQPTTILLTRTGENLQALLNDLPPGMKYERLDQRSGTIIGRVKFAAPSQ